jgi:hypothetical protein
MFYNIQKNLHYIIKYAYLYRVIKNKQDYESFKNIKRQHNINCNS